MMDEVALGILLIQLAEEIGDIRIGWFLEIFISWITGWEVILSAV
jgi:hypothetical protein